MAFTADASPSGVPIAGLAQWFVTREPATQTQTSSLESVTEHTFALGVYYSGRRNLQLGVAGSWEVGLPQITTNLGESNHPDAKSIHLDLRYFW